MLCKAEKMAFIVDGYDEINERDKAISSLNDVITGRVAAQSKVVITTRPHCVDEIAKICNGNYILVNLEGLTKASSDEYIKKMCATESSIGTRQQSEQEIKSMVPPEARHVPLLLNMAVLIHKWNCKHPTEAKEFPKIRTVTNVIGRVIGMFLALKIEKESGGETVPVYTSPTDEKIPNSTRRLISQFSKMCFECIKNKEFVISSETLERFYFKDIGILSKLGFLELKTNHLGELESAGCVHNQILEYFAAIHITENEYAMKYLIDIISSIKKEERSMAKNLDFWQDTLVFAAGISSKVLRKISQAPFSIKVQSDLNKYFKNGPDVNYEARLLHETENPEARDIFCEALMKAPLYTAKKLEVIY